MKGRVGENSQPGGVHHNHEGRQGCWHNIGVDVGLVFEQSDQSESLVPDLCTYSAWGEVIMPPYLFLFLS